VVDDAEDGVVGGEAATYAGGDGLTTRGKQLDAHHLALDEGGGVGGVELQVALVADARGDNADTEQEQHTS